MVSCSWKCGTNFGIHNNFWSTAICAISARTFGCKHNEHMNQKPFGLPNDGIGLSGQITLLLVDGKVVLILPCPTKFVAPPFEPFWSLQWLADTVSIWTRIPPNLLNSRTSKSSLIAMVSVQWKCGKNFGIHNNFCSMAICTILTSKVDSEHNQGMNQQPPGL